MDERYEVIGYREVDYVNKQGRKVMGRVLYTQYCRNDTVGLAVCEMYVPGNCVCDVNIGDVVTPLYNRRGRVQSVTLSCAADA